MEKIFYNRQTNLAYREDLTPIANKSKPTFIYSTERLFAVQYLNTLTLDTNKVPNDPYLGWDGVTITSTAAIDNNNNHYFTSLLNTAITAAASITTIIVDSPTGTPRIAGTLRLTNGTGQTEDINYNTFTVSGTEYTFNTADINFTIAAVTPLYSYAPLDSVRINELPIIKASGSNVDLTDQATGLIVYNIDANSLILGDLIEGSSSLDNVFFESTIFNSTGQREEANQLRVNLKGIIDDNGDVPPSPTPDWTNYDSRYVKQTLSSSYPAQTVVLGTEKTFIRDGASSKTITINQIKDFAADPGTEVSLPDVTETIIDIGATATHRYLDLRFTIDDSVDFDAFGYVIKHDDTNPQWMKVGSFIPSISGVTIDFDISGGQVRLKVDNQSGGALKLVWATPVKLTVST